jgi:ABC-2 type transport system permease protein
MREAFVIAKREFLERVRSKWFVVMTILWPLLMVAMIVVPALTAGRGFTGAKVEIADHSGKASEVMIGALEGEPLLWHASLAPAGATQDQLLERIRTKQINGFLIVPDDVLTGGAIEYFGDNASNQSVQILLQRVVESAVHKERAKEAGLTELQLGAILARVNVVAKHTTGKAEAMSGIETMILGFVLAFLLYIAIALYGINVMRSVVTEKSSRVVELLVAAVKPRALMAGKIIGVGGAGLAQLMIWLVVGAVALANRDAILGLFGLHGGGPAMLPSLDAGQIGIVLAFFIGGYIFYSSLFAAMGATVSSEQDTQQAQMPVTMLLVIAIVSMQAVTSDPRGSTSEVMTLVPFWSPILMPLRYFLGGATVAEVALSFGILAASTVLVARAAAKIYRVGILMYGKRPGLRELVRWLRY